MSGKTFLIDFNQSLSEVNKNNFEKNELNQKKKADSNVINKKSNDIASKKKANKMIKNDEIISQFSPNIQDELFKKSEISNFNEGGDDLSLPDDPNQRWGEGGGQYGRIKDYRNMEKVKTHMEGLVEFPAALSYRGIGGIIRSRVVILSDGTCDWERTKIQGQRYELRFYILTLLKQICRSNVWHNLKKRKSSNIDLLFNFDTFSHEEIKPKILGNVLIYHLPGRQQRGEWRLGPIKGNIYIPPAVFLNPQWIMENWNLLIHDEDPMIRFQKIDENLLRQDQKFSD